MSAIIGALRAELSASIADFQSDLGKAADSVKGFSKICATAADGLEKVGSRMSLAITAPLALMAKESITAAKNVTASLAQVTSALESTGGRSGKTAAELQKSAKALETLSTFDDDDILKQVSANLLRFGNISGDVFDRAQKAAVNLASRLGLDLSAAASVVGKALDQPVAGLQALSRLGVRFTEDQKKQITALVASGQGFKAQGLILKELEMRFDGAAAAARKASPDAALMQQWRDLEEAVGAILIKALAPFIAKLTDLTKAFNELSPAMQQNIVEWAGIAAVAGPALVILGTIIGAIGKIAPVVAALGEAIGGLFGEAGLAGIAATIGEIIAVFAPWIALIVAAGVLMWQARDVIVKAFQDIWDFGSQLLGDAFGNLLTTLGVAWTKLVAILLDLWNGPLGTFFKVLGQALAALAAGFVYYIGGTIIVLITTLVNIVSAAAIALVDSLDAVVKFLKGDFVGAWKAAKKTVSDTVDAFSGKTVKPPTVQATAPQIESVTVTATRPKQTFKPNFDLGPGADAAREKLDKLALAAKKDALEVRKFAEDGMDPLSKSLEEVDTKFEGIRDTIQGHITDLKRLTIQNAETRSVMKSLQDQLGALDVAHQKARTAAIAQYEAEKELADLQAQAQNLDTSNKIRDFNVASGRTQGPVTDAQQKLQAANDDLAKTQIEAAEQLKTLQMQRAAAEVKGDEDSVARLDGLIATQQKYYDLVTNTTGAQLAAAETINEAWKKVADSVSDSLLDVLTTFDLSADGVKNTLQSLLKEFLKPFTDNVGSVISGFAKSLFAGGFADGGFIPPGHWGVTGEQGMEATFGGRTGVSVIPQQEGSAPGTVYIDARGAVETVPAQIEAAIRAAAPGLIGTAVTQAGRNVPAQVASANKRKF